MKTSAVALAMMAAGADALLNLDVKLPLGIEADLDLLGPSSDPCGECSDTWHPPHDVVIDDCDDLENGDWHWVHPSHDHPEAEYSWTTSTYTAHQTSTIISCPPEVNNCPASSTHYSTVTVPEQTTICPAPIHPTPAVPNYGGFQPPQPVPQQPYAPPPAQPTYVPPQGGNNYAPPQGGNNFVPPQGGNNFVPPQGGNNYASPPVGGNYASPPPAGGNNWVPPQAQQTPYVPGSPAPTPYQQPGAYSPGFNTPWNPATPAIPGNPANTPAVPQAYQPPTGPYGINNGTVHPPTAGAAQNAQNMGIAIIVGLAAVALL